jgi:hypothetical protein
MYGSAKAGAVCRRTNVTAVDNRNAVQSGASFVTFRIIAYSRFLAGGARSVLRAWWM